MEDFERNQAEAHNEAGIETALTRLKDDLEKLKDAVYIPALPESIRLKFQSGGSCKVEVLLSPRYHALVMGGTK